MARLSWEELDKVKKKYNVSMLWSWSRVHCFQTSPYEYMLKYIQHIKEDRRDCIYATMGGLAHDIIEKLYSGKIKYEDMLNEFEDGWVIHREISGLKFDRNDEEHDKKIATKYYFDLKQFFKTHSMLTHKLALEKFVTAKIGSHVLQGYIDCCFKDDDGCYNIIDWKTSTIYRGKKAEEECGQLVVYAIALHQMGVPFDKIKIAWNFLKFCNVEYVQKNGNTKVREIERYKFGESLQTNTRIWLKDAGYSSDEIESYLSDLMYFNDLSVLPEEISSRYKVSDCYVYVPLTKELINRWYNEIDSTITEILTREAQYAKTHDETIFWDDDDSIKQESYYFSTLCGYSANLHKPYKQYLDSIGVTDLFNGDGQKDDVQEQKVSKVSIDGDDLSWLDNIL